MRSYRIVNDTGVGFGTKVIDPDGKELGGVRSISFGKIEPGQPITAQVELFTMAEVEARVEIALGGRVVKSVTFADGEVMEF